MIDLFSDIKPAIIPEEGKIVLYMVSGAGYSTAMNVTFTKEHPYQIVDVSEANTLLVTNRFRQATSKEVRAFYKIEK